MHVTRQQRAVGVFESYDIGLKNNNQKQDNNIKNTKQDKATQHEPL